MIKLQILISYILCKPIISETFEKILYDYIKCRINLQKLILSYYLFEGLAKCMNNESDIRN